MRGKQLSTICRNYARVVEREGRDALLALVQLVEETGAVESKEYGRRLSMTSARNLVADLLIILITSTFEFYNADFKIYREKVWLSGAL